MTHVAAPILQNGQRVGDHLIEVRPCGYYQYGDYGYYWVPGAWFFPPERESSGHPVTGD